MDLNKQLTDLQTALNDAQDELTQLQGKTPTLEELRSHTRDTNDLRDFISEIESRIETTKLDITEQRRIDDLNDEIANIEVALAGEQARHEKRQTVAGKINKTISALHKLRGELEALGGDFELSDFISAFTGIDQNLDNGFYRAVHGQGATIQTNDFWFKQLSPGVQTPTLYKAVLKEFSPNTARLEELESQLNRKRGELEA